MTLAQLRTLFRVYVFDTASDAFTDAQANSLINEAMKYVANIVSAVQPNLLLVDYTGTISNASSSFYVLQDLSAQTYPKVRRIIHAHNTGLSAAQESSLDIVSFMDIDKYKNTGATMSDRPQIFVYNETIGFVQPTNSTAVSVTYLHGLADMTSDSDTPGQVGGAGTANKLPTEWHDLIAMRAALVGMSADRRETNDLRGMFVETRDALLNSVQGRVNPQDRR